MKEYYDVYLSEIENWELKYGKRPQGAQEAVNKPNVNPVNATTETPVTWRTAAPIAAGKTNDSQVDIPAMYGRPATPLPVEPTTKEQERVTSKPKTTDLDGIFAQLATWKRPTSSPQAQMPPNIPSKGDDGQVVYTPFLPDAPTKRPDKGNSLLF